MDAIDGYWSSFLHLPVSESDASISTEDGDGRDNSLTARLRAASLSA